MFNKPLSQEDYDNHPASTTTFCDPISDINISPDDIRRALLSLDDNKSTGPIDILYTLDCASLLVKLKPRIFQRLPPFE